MINIEGLIKKVNLMPDSKEKAMNICTIYSYMNFLIDSRQIEKEKAQEILEQINDVEIFLKHYVVDEKKKISSLIDSVYILNPIYKDILNYANNYSLFNINIPNVNIKNLIEYAQDFLYSIDPNLISLFNKLIDNELIVETTLDEFGGKCHKINGEYSGIIIEFNTRNFYKAVTLVHEMGHAYYHYLNKSNPTLVRSNIANESMPRIFEQLFLLYLRENYLLDKNSLDQYERFFMLHQLHMTNSVYIFNKLLINEEIPVDFHVENMKALLSFQEYYDLSIIKQKDSDFQKYMSFMYNYYSYALILSMIIRENYIEDKDETIKLIKELPNLAIDMDAMEFIDQFDKNDYLNATKKNISRILSKTHYKK